MRRGLTLVETLGAIALLGAMAAASAHWITAALRLSSETSDAVGWEQAALRTLDLIARDLAVGDLGGEGPKAWVDGDRLIISTRVSSTERSPGGAVERVYTLRSTGGTRRLACELRGSDRTPARGAAAGTERVLLGDIRTFTVEVSDADGRLILTVSLASRSRELTREFEL